MERNVDPQEIADPVERPTSVELVKLIRKLRWIGLEDEARQLQIALDRFPAEQRATLPGAPSIATDGTATDR
jgi:hypothetical protein